MFEYNITELMQQDPLKGLKVFLICFNTVEDTTLITFVLESEDTIRELESYLDVPVLAYVYNVNYPYLSEFGMVQLENVKGHILRTY